MSTAPPATPFHDRLCAEARDAAHRPDEQAAERELDRCVRPPATELARSFLQSTPSLHVVSKALEIAMASLVVQALAHINDGEQRGLGLATVEDILASLALDLKFEIDLIAKGGPIVPTQSRPVH